MNSGVLKRTVEDIMVTLTQIAIRLGSRIFLLLIADLHIKNKHNARNLGKPLLIISNHKSYFDPLVIANIIPFFSNAYPLKFIAKDDFFKQIFSRIIFICMGAFPVYYGQGMEKTLEKPIKILKQEGSIFFFPEGQCIRNDEIAEGKIGAAILALKIPELNVLPIAIKNSYRINLFSFSRPEVKSIVGKPFKLKDKTESLDAKVVTDLFMNEIKNLYSLLN